MLISTYQLDEINKEITRCLYHTIWTRLPSQCFHITNNSAPVPYTQTDLSPFTTTERDGLVMNKVCLWNVSLLFSLLWKMWDINFVYTEHSHKITTQLRAMADHNFLFSFMTKGGNSCHCFYFFWASYSFQHDKYFALFCRTPKFNADYIIRLWLQN